MGILNRVRNALVELTKGNASPPPDFRWFDWPDPQLPDKRIHECDLPGGAYFLAQEVSAPEDGSGHWGWQLLSSDGDVMEMRNGFYNVEKTKEHAEEHYRNNYADKRT